MKLIPMIEFVLESDEKIGNPYTLEKYRQVTRNYANFLKQPLTLGMFVPCDEEGNPLRPVGAPFMKYEVEAYQQAKERVLFEGFKLQDTRGVYDIVRSKQWAIEFDEYGTRLICHCGNLDDERIHTVENLVMKHDSVRLELTSTALKQIEL